jgi:plasmid maintenance system antidote protein VapI
MSIPDEQPLPIAVRAYVCKADQTPLRAIKRKGGRKRPVPSEWALVFDTETTTDAGQKLRFGTYQVRKSSDLIEAGIFYDPETLNKTEQSTLNEYAAKHQLTMMTAQEFVEKIFYGVGYAYRASIVGFNLPFDISRLAIDHAPARGTRHNKIMRGGFTFKLSENHWQPRVQIKHVSSRDAFIQFAATKGQRTSRGNRKKGRFQPVRRGFFIDTKTLAAALTSQSHSLASLAQALGVAAQKHHTDEHGAALTPDYIDYAMQDTQTTWECYARLQSLYELHGLELTTSHNIHSEASLGKAYLRDMGVKPWKQMHPDFPDDIIGNIMSAYYGGRSEIHIRKTPVQILYCDFLSMYPTVCTLMGLWRFVTAQGMDWQDSTEETRKLLEEITIPDLQKQDTWQSLCTLVQVMPDGDIFPVRAKYGGDAQYTIGSNFLTSDTPLWFTVADCMSAKLLTGRAPKILRAISFQPKAMQDNLKPVCVAGNTDYAVDPCEGDFFRRVIDLRREVKEKSKTAAPQDKAALENQQLALKILANATSYGIFVELNVEEEKQAQPLLCYGHSGKPTQLEKKKFEATGSFFHPLLAALITGAARLMLAITERQALDEGLDWTFCDTDSMALAKPENMSIEEFYERARQVQEWFTPLNPYAEKAPLLKIEDYNYSLSDKSALQPLYCYAVSSKRYALFNMDQNGQPVLRKVSAHGLGHLIAPYQRQDTKMLEDSKPWQQDLWLEIIKAALESRQPDFESLKNFNIPAVSRYGATTPALEKWFVEYNKNKPYKDRVRPFNFLLAMQSPPYFKTLKPVASYDKNPSKAVARCFDRSTGEKIKKFQLKTYLDSLAQYHLHPETKFLNGDYVDTGITQRRHIRVKSIQHIGKEANKWEEQFFTGFNPDAQIEYGMCAEQKAEMIETVLKAINTHGVKPMADISKLSQRHVLNINKDKTNLSENALLKLYSAAKTLENTNTKENELRELIRNTIKENNISIRQLAANIGIEPSNLSKLISGKRRNLKQLNHIYKYLNNLKKDNN